MAMAYRSSGVGDRFCSPNTLDLTEDFASHINGKLSVINNYVIPIN